MSKKIIVLQDGLKECGSACLLSIIRYYRGNISMNRLLELTRTDKDGTNFYFLSKAAMEIGFIARAYQVDDLKKMTGFNLPFISQVNINHHHHFVVVYKIKHDKITLMDPARGMVVIKSEEFKEIFTGNILLLEPRKKIPSYREENYLWQVIKMSIIDNQKIILKLFSLTLIVTLFTCLYSYHFKIIIDNVLKTDKLNLLVITVIFMMILAIKLVNEFLRNNLLLYLNRKLDLSIITTTVKKIILLPYSYYKNKTTGEIISRVNDLLYIKNVVSKIIVTIFLDILLSIVVLPILFHISQRMSLLLLLITIIYFLIFFLFQKSIKRYTQMIQEDNAQVNSLLVESIGSYETIKGLNLESIFLKKINYQYLHTINDNLSLTKMSNLEEFLKDFFEGIILLFIVYVGSTFIMDKSLTLGSLITYNALLYYFLNPVKNFLDFYKELYYVKNSIKNINNILNYQYESLDTTSNLPIDGKITIDHLDFSYNGKNKVLSDISLVIPSNSKVLILGSSGSGKSTLLKIIYKYYQISRNQLYLGKYDIDDFTQADIHKNITYISQNELLYTDTIRNNITLSREINMADFIEVCNMTCIEDIIADKVGSYDYPLEENGANLSGGQRQRIILARSLLKQTGIILIDEGLNEMDINLERKILNKMFYKYLDKTIIIVSHRIDNIDLYDMVITLSNGKVKEVIAKNG